MLHKTPFLKTPFKVILFCFLSVLLFNCSDEEPEAGIILLTIENECMADVRLFDASGSQIDRKYYDCQEAKILVFKVKIFGALIFHAETSSGRKEKKVVSILSGKTIEASIVF